MPLNAASAQTTDVRARDLGVPFEGTPGRYNAITDVVGVEVGFATIVEGEGRTVIGEGPIRTGVTAIHPRGKESTDPVMAGWFTANAAGEMTGTTWLEERGFLEGPILITNTLSVGVVRDAAVAWMVENGWEFSWTTPVVGETSDSRMNDMKGQHVTREHAFDAMNTARGGTVAEGAVGGGTGMTCHRFKGGTGTASRIVRIAGTQYTVGVLAQCNYGSRSQLRIAGVPVGQEITDLLPCHAIPEGVEAPNLTPRCESPPAEGSPDYEDLYRVEPDGSIIVIVATDAPLLPHQLMRLAKRPTHGIARMGGTGGNGSGDIFVAFSTANPGAEGRTEPGPVTVVPNGYLTPIFEAAVQATEEAITNVLVGAETMTGANWLRLHGLPHDRLRDVLGRYNRLEGGR
jgi:L-aminopeptidase/D-esterase-like protein